MLSGSLRSSAQPLADARSWRQRKDLRQGRPSHVSLEQKCSLLRAQCQRAGQVRRTGALAFLRYRTCDKKFLQRAIAAKMPQPDRQQSKSFCRRTILVRNTNQPALRGKVELQGLEMIKDLRTWLGPRFFSCGRRPGGFHCLSRWARRWIRQGDRSPRRTAPQARPAVPAQRPPRIRKRPGARHGATVPLHRVPTVAYFLIFQLPIFAEHQIFGSYSLASRETGTVKSALRATGLRRAE